MVEFANQSLSLSVYCIYICVCVCVCYINYTVQYLLVDWRAIGWMVRCQAIRKAISLLKSPFHRGPGWWWWWFSIDKLRRYLSGGLLYKKKVSYHHFWGCMPNLLVIVFDLGLTLISLTWQWQQKHPQLIDDFNYQLKAQSSWVTYFPLSCSSIGKCPKHFKQGRDKS